MLKEIIQSLMKDPEAAQRLKNGRFELAGISEVEQRALLDALEDTNRVSKAGELGAWDTVKAAAAL
ncbi:competence protein ComX [Paenibacillus forsythiae]|uniref:ComX pheromone n=1 Tax=Paenibacillus forsythiae TaxID=365616 RepID=A0ABU3HBK7_9BACL|nr:competence pheromone ComX [Paenibacillus forsythiae]MDT3428166.1 competence protein ComX [Paenibacillus forsythiae]